MLYRERLTGKGNGATLTLFSKKIKAGWQVTIEHIGFYSEVNANRVCRIYLEGHGYKHYLTYITVTGGVEQGLDIRPITIDDNERLAFDFINTEVGEEFEVYLMGCSCIKG